MMKNRFYDVIISVKNQVTQHDAKHGHNNKYLNYFDSDATIQKKKRSKKKRKQERCVVEYMQFSFFLAIRNKAWLGKQINDGGVR